MKLGEEVNFSAPPHPQNVSLEGERVILEPLQVKKHAAGLFAANALDSAGNNWTYLPYGPFATLEAYTKWLQSIAMQADPYFLVISNRKSLKPLGVASYLCIQVTTGSIEVGHINFSLPLQRTTEATEAMYLMMKWAFENGYRRCEWKCNALNIKSRNAAQRLGLSYEGVFRQATVNKGRNRDTAWFAAIDKEWPALKQCFIEYLSDKNFDAEGRQIKPLSTLTKALLFKVDDNMLA